MKQTAILLLHCPDQQGIISDKEILFTLTNMWTSKTACFLCVLNGNWNIS